MAKAAERDRKRAEKEPEEETQRVAKIAERDRKRAEKEAEEEAQRVAKVASKLGNGLSTSDIKNRDDISFAKIASKLGNGLKRNDIKNGWNHHLKDKLQ